MNPEEFFREITLRICSSLDIKVVLTRCFEYLELHFPLDEIALDIYDSQLSAIRRIAHVAASGKRVDEIVPLPENVWNWVRNLTEPMTMTASTDLPVAQATAPLVMREGNSDLVVPLSIGKKKIGLLILRAYGDEKYERKHLNLIKIVSEPFALSLSNALAHEELLNYSNTLLDDNTFLQRELSSGLDEEIVGRDSGLRNVMDMVRQVASLNNTVLLVGETGVGKEVIANAIHCSSTRKEAPFIKVNCGAIPDSLIDSELFGYEKGAFTSANKDKRGRFERANTGTIFLDEIGELPLPAQVRLLRVLQNREIERVGGSKSIALDIRVLTATHRNLEQMIREGKFREDLWFRVNMFPIFIPPLRQRREDIPALTRWFVRRKSKELGLRKPPAIVPGALDRLVKYDWPGNVRELQNVIEREIILFEGGPLEFRSLLPGSEELKSHSFHKEPNLPEPVRLDEAMALHIGKVLAFTKGKIHGPGGAAQFLDINPNTLRSRMQKLGIK
ncbi:sigma-54 interaction domain protein [delta proteobacterium NaphS2]|nr:sigma-54 interaction domain protein [delta proteobacterium NaphS2]